MEKSEVSINSYSFEIFRSPISIRLFSLSGHNLLDLLYKNPDRFAMPFQDYVTLTMLKHHIKPTSKPVKLMERSIFSARYCFVEKMLRSNMIHESMYHVLQEWYDFIHEHHQIHCDLVVYLRTTPEVAHGRVKLRARDEESCVPIQYLSDLHDLHERWLIHGEFYRPAPVHVIDANLGLDKIIDEYQRSEPSILRKHSSIYIENTNHGVTVSPSKRCDREMRY